MKPIQLRNPESHCADGRNDHKIKFGCATDFAVAMGLNAKDFIAEADVIFSFCMHSVGTESNVFRVCGN